MAAIGVVVSTLDACITSVTCRLSHGFLLGLKRPCVLAQLSSYPHATQVARQACRLKMPATPEGGITHQKLLLRDFIPYHHHPAQTCVNVAFVSTFTISSHSILHPRIFCASRGFMLRPPIIISRRKDSYQPNRLSSFLVCLALSVKAS